MTEFEYESEYTQIAEHKNKKLNKDKRKPKGDIKFNISLNEEQKAAKKIILENAITHLKGDAGSGKTLLAAQVALDLLFNREIEKIIICRPAVSKEDLGYLPGSADDKLQPYLQPVLDNFYKLCAPEKIDKLFKDNVIQILPFAFMRGHTFTDSYIIVDEAQNLLDEQMELVLERLGFGSKMVVCGDLSQVDLRNKKDSGIAFLTKLSLEVDGFEIVTLKENHRHPIVQDIVNVYKKYI